MAKKKFVQKIRNPADVRKGIKAEHTTYDPKTGRESSKNIGGKQYKLKYSSSSKSEVPKQQVGKETTLEQEKKEIKQKQEEINKGRLKYQLQQKEQQRFSDLYDIPPGSFLSLNDKQRISDL